MEKKIERKKKDEGLENRKKKSRGTKSKGLFVLRNHDKRNLITKRKKDGHSSKKLVLVLVKMISLFSATNPLLTWSPSSTPTRISYSQTLRRCCTSRTTNALSFHIPFSLTCSRLTQKPNAHTTTNLQVQGSSSDSNKEEQEEEYKVLTAVKSQYNDILIVDTPKTRMLLLDSTRNFLLIHLSFLFSFFGEGVLFLFFNVWWLIIQIMFIAFFTRMVRNGLVHIGYVCYVKLPSFLVFVI